MLGLHNNKDISDYINTFFIFQILQLGYESVAIEAYAMDISTVH